MQTDLLRVSRSSLYYQPRPPQSEEVQLKHRIDEIYTQLPYYGSRKIAAQLQREGMGINRKTVARYMQEMGIAAVYPGPNLSKRNQKEGVYPVPITSYQQCVSQSYLGDRYHLHSPERRLDVSGRYAGLVFQVCDQLGTGSDVGAALCLDHGQRALGQAVPVICNSDQGSHFTSPQYLDLLKTANVQISMDGKGRALDNIFTERLWRTVKYEEVYIHDYLSPREARQALTRYFAFYNQERLHQALDYQTPAEVYFHKASTRPLRTQ